jgi:hypothetical protein
VKAVRWSPHALKSLADREIDRAEADRALAAPEFVGPGQPGRMVLMRRYFDEVLRQEMLLRIVVEDAGEETTVVTVYKTSQIEKYVKGLLP